MDKLVDTAHTAAAAIKEKVPFLEGDSEPESETNGSVLSSDRYVEDKKGRLRDRETGRFVAREKALGETAVRQVIKPASSQRTNGSGGTNGETAANHRYSIVYRQEQRARLEVLDAERYQAWNEQLANGRGADEAFNQAMAEREQRVQQEAQIRLYEQFSRGMQGLDAGTAQERRVFALADQVRKARAEFNRLLDEGELDEEGYLHRLRDRKEHEDRLQDLLIKYRDSISQDQQDFIIDYSGGTYNDMLEAPVSTDAGDTEDDTTVDRGSTEIPQDRAIVLVEEAENPETSADEAEEENPESFGAWPGFEAAQDDSGEAEDDEEVAAPELHIDSLIEEFTPLLYERYKEIRSEYIEAHANARFADIGAVIDKFASNDNWLEQTRDELGKRFNTRGHKRRMAYENFKKQYVDALNAALRSYSVLTSADMTPEERRERRLALEKDAMERLEQDISDRKIAVDSEKSRISRKAGVILGLGGAAVVGAGAAFANQLTSGNYSPYALGSAMFVGGAAGFSAEKYSRRLAAADTAARIKYGAGSVDLNYQDEVAENRAVALEAIEGNTNHDQYKRLGARTTWALGGAAVAWGAYTGTNYLIERSGTNLNLYNDAGTESHPRGVDFDPFDGNGIDVVPDFGDGNSNENVAPAATETPTPTATETPAATETPTATETPETPPEAAVGADDTPDDEGIIGSPDGTDATKPNKTAPGGETSGTEIYVQPGSGFTQEFQDLYPSLTDQQAYDMYLDLMKEYRPGDIFANVEFFRLPNGDWGMVDTGPATLTPKGHEAIQSWLSEYGHARGV